MSMSLEEARKIVFDTVKEHGPERAKGILLERVGNDPDFELAVARHGLEIVKAMHDAESGATMH